MFLRDDAADRQLQRLTSKNQRGHSFHSWSSETTTASSKDGATGSSSDALLHALIRDLSFWDAIPPCSKSTSMFPSPLPQRPTSHDGYQNGQILKRGRSAATVSSSNSPERQTSNSRRNRDKSNRHESSARSKNNRGTISNSNEHTGWGQPLPTPQWKSTVDPTSGSTYWYDAVTRRTQWETVSFIIMFVFLRRHHQTE